MLEVKARPLLIGAREREHLRLGIEAAEERDAGGPAFGCEAVRHRDRGIAAQVRHLKMIADRARRRSRRRRIRPTCPPRPTWPTWPTWPTCPTRPTRPHIDVRRDVD